MYEKNNLLIVEIGNKVSIIREENDATKITRYMANIDGHLVLIPKQTFLSLCEGREIKQVYEYKYLDENYKTYSKFYEKELK